MVRTQGDLINFYWILGDLDYGNMTEWLTTVLTEAEANNEKVRAAASVRVMRPLSALLGLDHLAHSGHGTGPGHRRLVRTVYVPHATLLLTHD